MKDRQNIEVDMGLTALRIALMTGDNEAVHRITGMMMGAIFSEFMDNYFKWCGKTDVLQGPFLAMAELFTETIRSLCDETDLDAAEHIRENTDVTMVNLADIKEQVEKKKRGDEEK